jgi:flagellar hook-associated protein 1 FlgK
LSGGAIGGLLEARRYLVDPALEKLGRVAVSLTSRVNAVQAQGITQDGSVGTAVFADISGTALAARTNTGNASVQAGFSNLSAVTGEDMILRYNGSQWQMSNARSGQSVAFTGTGTTADPLQAGGMSLTLSGTANAGDSFSISPTHDAAGAVQRIAVDGSAFATAGRLSAAASLSNLGTVSIAAPAVSDASNPQLTTPVSISFLSAGSFQIGSGAAQAYTSGSSISANGWSLTLTGTPQAGDRFTVSPTGVGSSDNRNANALAGIASEKLLDAGRSTLSAANNALVTQTGSVAQQASVAKDAADAVRTQSQKERDSVSGVNLDEEAANLVRYQQAYQAAAQVIATAGTVFESVLAATRR